MMTPFIFMVIQVERKTVMTNIIATLFLDLENAKHEYDVVIDNKNELEKCFDDLKFENEALKLELENKNKALNECMHA